MKRAADLFLTTGLFLLAFAMISQTGICETKSAEKKPAEFESIHVAPANTENLRQEFELTDPDDEMEGAQPPSIAYYIKNTKDYTTSMAVTDLSLCKTSDQKSTCESFNKMIAGEAPSIGTDITETRIEGQDYGTVFLAPVASVKYDGVDQFKAFIGGDSQDPPYSNVVLYVYARKGTNLIQLTAPVAECNQQPGSNQTDVSYYKQFCVTPAILEKAKAAGNKLADLFKLKP